MKVEGVIFRWALLLLMWYGSLLPVCGQQLFRAMFYNVENLFDTVDNPEKRDEDFLPDGRMRWTPYRYWEKQKNITRVITAVGEMQSPALVGLCEVENDSCLFDLTKRSPLRNQGYEYVITDSPDERGINVALLYQEHQFSLAMWHEYEVEFSKQGSRPTRNILHAVGQLINGDTLDVFVCHAPSRFGGQLETLRMREDAMRTVRKKVDSVMVERSMANVLIMGDFNDYPDNKSLYEALGAKGVKQAWSDTRLYNLFYDRMNERDFGTYYFQGKWGVLDQMIVSGNLLRNNHSVRVFGNGAQVFKADFLLKKNRKTGEESPHRTYAGESYQGGFSDHLPIYLDLFIK